MSTLTELIFTCLPPARHRNISWALLDASGKSNKIMLNLSIFFVTSIPSSYATLLLVLVPKCKCSVCSGLYCGVVGCFSFFPMFLLIYSMARLLMEHLDYIETGQVEYHFESGNTTRKCRWWCNLMPPVLLVCNRGGNCKVPNLNGKFSRKCCWWWALYWAGSY